MARQVLTDWRQHPPLLNATKRLEVLEAEGMVLAAKAERATAAADRARQDAERYAELAVRSLAKSEEQAEKREQAQEGELSDYGRRLRVAAISKHVRGGW